MIEDFERCYRAVSSRDARFDGYFFTGVLTTRIYCRPSCPAITPKRANVRFFRSAAAAQLAGLRACKRCRPDATPGSPEWNIRADVIGRAMRLIDDGIVDREGVGGLARRLHLSERHLHRQLVAEVGAGPQALARARRAETGRLLIETTSLRMADIAFAAGFASIRQFNDTIRAVFGTSPRELRRARGDSAPAVPTSVSLRLPYRAPFPAESLLRFLGDRAIDGVESWDGTTYRRTLALPNGRGTVALTPAESAITCDLALTDLRDLGAAVRRCRALLDLDADPVAIADVLERDPRLRRLVHVRPGLRLPGTVDPHELAVRAVLGQQVSVAGARTLAAKLVRAYGAELPEPHDDLTHLFPTAETLAAARLDKIGMPRSRKRTLRSLAGALAAEEIVLDPSVDRDDARRLLLAIPGIGPWTASYIEMRALGDPDAFLPTDLGVVKAAEKLGIADLEERARRWRPWRSYAVQYLWDSLTPSVDERSQHVQSAS